MAPATPRGYAIWLQDNLPKEFLSVFDGWIRESRVGNPVKHLMAIECEQRGAFLWMSALKIGEPPWNVQIPLSFVISITEVEDTSKKIEFGFR